MRRAVLTSVLAILVLAWPGASALAVDQTVHASSNGDDLFAPRTVTIAVGQTVHWQNDSGTHNVVADNGSFKLGGDPVTHSPTDTRWKAQFTFNKAGTFQYYCSEHGDKGGVGMSGKVIVKGPPDKTPPKITAVSANPASFCTNKSQTCTKRGTTVKLTLSEAASVKGSVKPAGTKKPFVQVFKKQLGKGKRSVAYSGSGLKPGKYVLRLGATDAAGNHSKPVTIAVTVKNKG
jgi:plastocyanin